MTKKLKHDIGIKKGIYKKIKGGQEQLRNRYNELTRNIKKNVRKAKRDYEIKIARESKANPKGFFQVYRTKVKEKIGPLKSERGEVDR